MIHKSWPAFYEVLLGFDLDNPIPNGEDQHVHVTGVNLYAKHQVGDVTSIVDILAIEAN